MSEEDPICKMYGYRYILALPSNLKRVLVLVHWKYVLLHNARKMCITHYSREIEILESQTQIQVDKSIFVRIKKLYSYFLVLKFIEIKIVSRLSQFSCRVFGKRLWTTKLVANVLHLPPNIRIMQ